MKIFVSIASFVLSIGSFIFAAIFFIFYGGFFPNGDGEPLKQNFMPTIIFAALGLIFLMPPIIFFIDSLKSKRNEK